MNRLVAAVLISLGMLSATGCKHLGPKTVAVDRFDYSTASADSWQQQTLLNIIKLRYMDLPVFVDAASIVNGYSMQTGVSVNGTLSSEEAIQGNYASIGGQALCTDRPTITYVPMPGEKFLRGLVTPIDPKNIFFLLQSGDAADFIPGMAVESLNGVRNRSTAGGTVREAEPEFFRVLDLLREVRAAGAFGMRVEQDRVKGSTGVVFSRRDDAPAEIAEKGAETRRLLKLPPDQQKLVLTYSPTRGAENELAVNSRSMLQIMQAFASRLDAPEAHLKDHSAWPSLDTATTAEISPGKTCGFTAARRSRQARLPPCLTATTGSGLTTATCNPSALTVVMLFFTLADTGSPEKLPLITIPAQ